MRQARSRADGYLRTSSRTSSSNRSAVATKAWPPRGSCSVRSLSTIAPGDQREIIKKGHQRAQEMLAQVIEKLKKYDGTSPPEIKTSLDDNMHDSSVQLAAGLAERLARLAPDGDDTQ
jgi:hypothetical protein